MCEVTLPYCQGFREQKTDLAREDREDNVAA